jgi:rSAM/selenodomain-associated transferase 2
LEKNAAEVSIIVPVLNEAEHINGIIGHLRAINAYYGSEIIVVDGDPQGSTVHVIEDREVRTLISAQGRARQMNQGASAASGDILLFLHADTRLPENALACLVSAMRDGKFVAGAFDLGFNTKRRIFRVAERYVFFRTRLTRVPFGDQAILVRREYFSRIGGFPDIPIMEDVELMKRIKKEGDRIIIIPNKVMTSPRRYEQEGILYCTFRNLTLQLLYALGASPERLVRWYRY